MLIQVTFFKAVIATLLLRAVLNLQQKLISSFSTQNTDIRLPITITKAKHVFF